ncbi:GNAT family N-acetyltransferase [Photobacterium minamisatsumaniensis]|uniref:GNAT family N-acetyltransferase n=1 Tax=Photobacterium minamisatsumaniensis TaxID=2910233 RepID=UPI003D113357
MSKLSITQVNKNNAEIVGCFVFAMEKELWPDDSEHLVELEFIQSAQSLLTSTGFWAFQAQDGGKTLGIITLCEKKAIYANGSFGEVIELYILPQYRSQNIGAQLIEAVKLFSSEQGWPFLEVGAPAQPRWAKTLAFYKQQGFKEIGPRLELGL